MVLILSFSNELEKKKKIQKSGKFFFVFCKKYYPINFDNDKIKIINLNDDVDFYFMKFILIGYHFFF